MPVAVAKKLREGHALDDTDFDALLPQWGRWLSTIHWTPLSVARRAAQLLVNRPGMKVLDVGAGVGKFSLIGALTTAGQFHGIEQRFHFVKAAREIAEKLGVHNARFSYGNMMDLDWSLYDGFYLFNPFAENLATDMEPLDRSVDVEPMLFKRYVAFVERELARARVGTRVLLYHGFGGDMPGTYQLEWDEAAWTDSLELWVKAA